MRRLVMNQAHSIIGPSKVVRDIHSLRKYALGNAIPVKRTWIAITIRVISKVRSSRDSSLPPTQSRGLKIFAHNGPKTIPATIANSASADGHQYVGSREPGQSRDIYSHMKSFSFKK